MESKQINSRPTSTVAHMKRYLNYGLVVSSVMGNILFSWRSCSPLLQDVFNGLARSPQNAALLLVQGAQSTLTDADESEPAFVSLYLDEPLKLELNLSSHGNATSVTAQVIFASAIPQENAVAFVVVDNGVDVPGYTGRQALQEIPPGIGCAFSAGEIGDEMTETLEVTSMVQVHATTQRFYNSSSIWMCELPKAHALKGSSHVTIVLPGWAKHISGHGRFSLNQRLTDHNLTGEIHACGKHIFHVNELTSKHVQEYISYYRKLGVGHFTFYFEIGWGENVSAITSSIHNHARKDVTFIHIPAALRQLWNPNDRIQLLQSFTVNDCLWRSRGADANWTMMLFDLDEFLVGTHHLPTFLSDWSHPLLYVRQHLVKFPHSMPRMKQKLNISQATPTWGKTMFRSAQVDVAWVHSITSPKLAFKDSKQLKLLHFRNMTTATGYNNWKPEWTEIVT